MKILHLNYLKVEKYRKNIVNFIKKNGDRRITKEAINWVSKAGQQDIDREGTILLACMDMNKVVGVLIAADYGREESFIVVHKGYRNQNIAKTMVKECIQNVGKIYGRIAVDNTPSLKVCLDNDMVAFHLFEGPTGKPTLWLGGGNWTKEDVL